MDNIKERNINEDIGEAKPIFRSQLAAHKLHGLGH